MAERIALISEFCQDYYSSQKCAEISKLFFIKILYNIFCACAEVVSKKRRLSFMSRNQNKP